jgi:dienelactone hydrolase
MDNNDENEEKKKGLSATAKKRIMAVAAALLAGGLSMGTVVGCVQLYDTFFKRYERPDYTQTPGLYCYDRVSDILEREELSFYSDGVRLQGYYYPSSLSKGLVVISHGMHAGADDYLPATLYFVQNGYNVFAYDYKGTYSSDGTSTVGMCESLIDLDHALTFVESNSRFRDQKIFLFGHSWGGFASASVMNLHTNISGCAVVAPFNSGYNLIVEKGYQYGGNLASGGLPKKFLDVYQKYLFKDYVNYDGVGGINNVSCPVFIAHGNNDGVISFNGQSIISHRAEITNKRVTYYIGEGLQSGHDSIWHSSRSIEYQKQVNAKIKEIKSDKSVSDTKAKIAEYVATVDHSLYSEVNPDLFSQILTMFDGEL